MATPPDLEWFRRKLKRSRDLTNINNPNRTMYYNRYWKTHPEVPWTLLADLVSRNAGYQMTDLARFSGWIDRKYPLPSSLLNPIGVPHLRAIFALIEVGNYLIFRDIFPPLEVYAKAMKFPEYSDALFDLLLDPEFGTDPYILQRWKSFFQTAQAKVGGPDWDVWVNDFSDGSDMQQHTFALVINEQHQIQDRIINDKSGYFRSFKVMIQAQKIIQTLTSLGMTALCFPVSRDLTSKFPVANQLLLYRLDDFSVLDNRINTGRDTFVRLLNDANQRAHIKYWAIRRHTGTRRDYNTATYSLHYASLGPGGETYSPPLDYKAPSGGLAAAAFGERTKSAWPYVPKNSPLYKPLYRKPDAIDGLVAAHGQAQIDQWLLPHAQQNPPRSPKPVISAPIAARQEILF